MTPAVERLRTAVACLLVTALVFTQQAGRVVSDTKLDLTADPAGLLARALHLWDAQGGAGQLQNQAYGYLFPTGPAFLGLQALGLPDWAAQRVWQSLVLCLALVGVQSLARRMGYGSPATRLLAGVVYAFAARPVSQVGALSSEVLPYALAPWVLVPLVTGAQRGSPRRAAALSGAAVLLVGGINAAATLAVLPLGALWIAVQPAGVRRRLLARWWAVAVVCATAWWVGPLLLLGKYSPPFLDVIESAATTTAQTGLWSLLTGNDLWLQYLAIGEPARPAGFLLVTEAVLVVAATAVSALGLVGVVRQTTPHRGFLVGGLLLGLLVVGAGHVGPLDSPFSGVERDLLDGALAPFRNVHKYDLLLRLPLALGLAHAASEVRLARVRPVALMAGLALVGVASPALGKLEPPGSYTAVPGYWKDVAGYLGSSGPVDGRALVVPAASFGDYAWGRPLDEPLQPLATSPWVVRDAVPLGGPGVTRVLDVVEEVLRGGRGSPALSTFLARAGIRDLVVRNDLDANATGSTRPVVVHAALAASPGLRRVASFGPVVGAGFGTGATVIDQQLEPTYPAVEVYRVTGSSTLVATQPQAGALRVAGGPEAVLPLLESGLATASTATLLGATGAGGTVTDTYRDREVDFGRATDNASATLGAGTTTQLSRPVHDYLPVDSPRTSAVLHAITSASASSSASDAGALLLHGRDHNPAAAFDGDGATSWVSGGLVPTGQWVQAAFPAARVTAVDLQVPLVDGVGATATRVRLTTDTGHHDVDLTAGTTTVPLRGVTSRLRVTVLSATGFRRFGLVALEVRLHVGERDLLAQPGLLLPAEARGSAFAFAAGRRDRAGCVRVGDRPVCASGLALGDEDDAAIDRTFTLDRDALLGVAITGRPRPGPALDALLQQDSPVTVTASSSAVPDPAARPAAVLDRDARTGWLAAPLDPSPTLQLRLASPARLTGLQVLVDQYLAASRPRSVGVTVDGTSLGTLRIRSEKVAFPRPVTGRVLRLTFPDMAVRSSLRPDGLVERLPVGITELRLLGPAQDTLRPVVDRSRVLTLPCGTGPLLAVDEQLRLVTRVTTTVGALLDGGPVAVEVCNLPLELTAGEHRVRIARTDVLQLTGLTLSDLARPAPVETASRVTRVRRWDSAHRTVVVASGEPAWLVVREAFNQGWRATLGGQRLTPVLLGGWQQGFELPRAGGEVRLVFTPDRPYLVSLLIGLLLALGLVPLAVVRARRPLLGAVRRTRRLGPLLALLAVPLLTGAAGAVAVLLCLLLRRPRLLGPVAVLSLLVAGGMVAAEPWPSRALLGTPVQVACLLCVAALAVSLWPGAPRVAVPAPTTSAAAPAPPRPAATPMRARGSLAPPVTPTARSDR